MLLLMEANWVRFLGNKESIQHKIIEFLNDKKLVDKELVFFDAFCGSGSVSDSVKDHFNLIVNDIMVWSVIYSLGRINSYKCIFASLGFDPIEYLNKTKHSREGFIFKNYSPGASERKYFSAENAGRIDFFRWQIEEWYVDNRITKDEYNYLLACLIESVSKVSNTAGVYGAFLKTWDSRSIKPIEFIKVAANNVSCNSVQAYNGRIEDIISQVECDVLYIDPPYTQNQYGTQYHLLETLVLDDSPSISPITGSRPTAQMRSDWSKEYKANILFDRVIATTSAKHILFSYNSDGFLTKEFIEASLKRYGKPETYECRKIPYKKYQNWKSNNDSEHYEYLFYIEKKPLQEIIYESPLNYIGSKSKIINDIKKHLPSNIGSFYDVFGGGFNVGININAPHVIYNDTNYLVTDLIKSFKYNDTYTYIKYIKNTIKTYNLEKANSESYIKAREIYNSTAPSLRDPRFLFTLIMYGYQQQIRFNSSHEFNNPIGMRWFNDKILEKLISFSRRIREIDCQFFSLDYSTFTEFCSANSLVYFDPPYKLTRGSYNDGKRGFDGWNDALENRLIEYLDNLNTQGVRFMLSYVIEYSGVHNTQIQSWIAKRGYFVIYLKDVLGISGSRRDEVLITNYEMV